MTPHRILFFAPFAPAIAVIALAAASGAASLAATNGAEPGFAENAIEDVQVGESGDLIRIALICRTDCRVGARAGGAFFLPDVVASLAIDLQGRATLAQTLEFTPIDGGSALRVRSDGDVATASIKPCPIDGLAASCIDIRYQPAPTEVAAIGTPSIARKTAPPRRADAPPQDAKQERRAEAATPDQTSKPAPELREQPLADRLALAETRRTDTAQEQPALREDAAPLVEPVAANEPPPLRDAPGADRLVFASLAAPERFDPPAPVIASFVLPASREEPGPIILERRAIAFLAADFDLRAKAEEILERRFGVAECGGAQARLRADAWALDAMVDVGFCEAAAGELEKADGVFARLLAYTPDNYAALVGRALIAAKDGERTLARRYFEDALDALPPIAESNRIVDTIDAL